MNIDTPSYQKAFENYLRHGIAPEAQQKAAKADLQDLLRERARRARAGDMLNIRFAQQLDPELQEHHGVEQYQWVGGSCPVCAAFNGQIYPVGAGPLPPGCEYCACGTAPVFDRQEGEEEEQLPYDPPIEPVYPEFLLPIFGIGRGAWALARTLLGSPDKPSVRENLTSHGTKRSIERNITAREEREAIRSAMRTGNITTKTGKYGTPQIHYHGSNGITVIVETSGRQAGKVITFYRR